MHFSPADMRSTSSTSRLLVATFAAVTVGFLAFDGCGASANDATAVRVGAHTITIGTVAHWISVLKGRGSNGNAPGPPAPVPPHYKTCIAFAIAHSTPSLQPSSTPRQPKAYCEYEYRRFKLKALYLLISYQWVTGEAAELGVRLNRPELERQLAFFRNALGLSSDAAYRRYLRFTRADNADVLLSIETEQLTRAVVAKVSGGRSPASAERVLKSFGQAYLRRWLARTDCRTGYVVPICREYRPPKTPPEFVPPTVPLTFMPSGTVSQ